ncbi:Rieske 2Fe-2S domain-containing protein [Dyella sp. BiH032]|uniref:Rieske 2Fe-2S domain-containing protein n=1 Tax=Dyella sp. BiH032 TaxID=3075430 RepID=UPI002892E1E3|nr:Rieske 2Fe-2S domain-containing protein [Dyella sp. BiH032]WNL44236.1 Rieske 2Fe-2S domain-containing protein [Dyella sp. BiH032]
MKPPTRTTANAHGARIGTLSPFPDGWFAAAFSSELKPGAVRTIRFMGGERVLYRTRSGRACMVEPHCPHLGAHLGHGGQVDGDLLVCPFHSFRYATDGHCVSHGPQSGPGRIRTRTWPLRELHGVIHAWHGAGGGEPAWPLPEADLEGFSAARETSLDVRGHIQNFTENTIDQGHYAPIHALTDFRLDPPPRFDGHRMAVDLAARWRGLPFRMHLDIHGLGYCHLTSELPQLGARIAALVLPTPTGEETWVLRHAQRLRIPAFSRLPAPLRDAFYVPLTWYIDRWLKTQLTLDTRIWNYRRYPEHPRLVQSDGPIMAYRRWAAQFYPAGESAPADMRQADTERRPANEIARSHVRADALYSSSPLSDPS